MPLKSWSWSLLLSLKADPWTELVWLIVFIFFSPRRAWGTFQGVNGLISGPNWLRSKFPHSVLLILIDCTLLLKILPQYMRQGEVSGQALSHLHTNNMHVLFCCCYFFFFMLLCTLQVCVPVQPFFTAQGASGVWLHQQAHHPRSDQTDHSHPQQGESHAHCTIFVPWLQDIYFHWKPLIKTPPKIPHKHSPLVICYIIVT